MKIIGMIPARGGSSRFNMKPLAQICGKPMLYWVWKHSKEVAEFDEVYVATDNEEIKAVAEGFGAKVLMTSSECETATERLYEVANMVEADLYVMVNGDEPLVLAEDIVKCIPESIPEDGFYMTVFDADKITRPNMDAEKDGVMEAVYLKEVTEDYKAPGHRFGCSGIDGTTFAPAFGEKSGKQYLYVSYGIYSDTARSDNDHQVILQYDISGWSRYAKPLNQTGMHRSGPEKPDGKLFAFTGNTTYGVQNLEYDPHSRLMLMCVYPGKKEQFPNRPLYFLDCEKAPSENMLLTLAPVGLPHPSGIFGSRFHLGSTGIASLGDGRFLISEPFHAENGFGSRVRCYRFQKETGDFVQI